MKNKQTIFKTVLLCALTVLLFSCNKDIVEPTPPTVDYSTFTDTRDGKIYKTFKIGNQEWMAENLAYKTTFGSWNAGYTEADGTKYGRLYTWEAAKQAVPKGWHLPSDTEWKQLEMALGMNQADADGIDFRGTDEGSKLKSTSGWSENGNGTDAVGFSALPGGFRSNSGINFVFLWYAYYWTGSDDNSSAWFRLVTYFNSKVYRNLSYKGEGYSVRCVKD